MLDGLTSLIRANLREAIMERIEPDIRAAIDTAMDTFKVRIEASEDAVRGHPVVNVLIDRVNRKAP